MFVLKLLLVWWLYYCLISGHLSDWTIFGQKQRLCCSRTSSSHELFRLFLCLIFVSKTTIRILQLIKVLINRLSVQGLEFFNFNKLFSYIIRWFSLCSKIQQQLQSLLETLNTTEPHYIRCVKPNNVLKPEIFENINVLHQLRCGVSLMFSENLML